MKDETCYHCDETVHSSDKKVSTGCGDVHLECHEAFLKEMEDDMAAEARAYRLDQKNTERVLKKLEQTLKPKIWQPIKWETEAHGYGYLSIVTRDKVKGEKRTGHDYFGESTAMRHVYDDTSCCSYSGSYGGEVYLRLSNNRYLKMHIWG